MPSSTVHYSDEYKTKLYVQWYNGGKPSAGKFSLVIEPYEGKIPNELTLQVWIRQWEIDCEQLDIDVRKQFESELVASKVKMFRAQAKEAKELRVLAFTWLKDHWDELTPSVAVRLWTEAMTIEQGIAGIPEAIEKMMNMSDEKLLEETAKFLEEANIDSIDAISDQNSA